MKRLTVAVVAALCSPLALALEKPYVGLDYQIGTYEAFNTEANPETARLRLGTEITPRLAIEAQIGASAQTDVLNRPGASYEIKVDSYYALFLRPQISVGNFASIYGLLGGTYMDVSASVINTSSSLAATSDKGFDKSFSYGAGIDFTVHKDIRLGMDYIKYIDGYSAVSAGVRIPIH